MDYTEAMWDQLHAKLDRYYSKLRNAQLMWRAVDWDELDNYDADAGDLERFIKHYSDDAEREVSRQIAAMKDSRIEVFGLYPNRPVLGLYGIIGACSKEDLPDGDAATLRARIRKLAEDKLDSLIVSGVLFPLEDHSGTVKGEGTK